MSKPTLTIKRHTLIANKLLVLFSGLSRNTKVDDKYYYEKHAFGIDSKFLPIPGEFKWTSSLIKQVIAYVAKSNSEGFISFLSEEELANTIHCSVRTIRNNNKLLEDKGIIRWDRIFGEYIKVELVDYLLQFLDLQPKDIANIKKDDVFADVKEYIANVKVDLLGEELTDYVSKGGYTSISDDVIYELFKIKDVNVLRLAMRALYSFEKEVNVKENSEAVVSYSEIKNVLPPYIGYKSAIRKMADKLSHIFQLELFEGNQCIRTFFEEKKANKSIENKIKDGFVLSFNLVGTKHSKQQKRTEAILGVFEFNKFARNIESWGGSLDITEKQIKSLVYEFGLESLNKTIVSIEKNINESIKTLNDSKGFLDRMKENTYGFIRNIANGYYQAKITA
ncbi:hypothetical protein CN515_04760 [Bacillus cereus]|uniref:hypothetical protein n=1 Tax=Bacillus cereus TaxID=1396 RepID=UPI000BF83FAD|nr:hypothetical protein [Bacillus cereus]PES55360.1 hypothetical protein CN515_04760 [Bacillus cereus]